MFAIGYRMLGSAAAAEDAIQDAWLRWQRADPAAIESDKAWLSTVVTRLCLDRLKSAQRTREQYVGPWLPEPIRTEERVDPDAISMAFLVLLRADHERLLASFAYAVSTGDPKAVQRALAGSF